MIKSFSHTYECTLCLTPCKNVFKRHVYPSAKECEYRSRETIISDVDKAIRNINTIDDYHGHKNRLPILFKDIMYPYTSTVDWFHSVLQESFLCDFKNIFITGFYVNNDDFMVPPLRNIYRIMFDKAASNNKISRCFSRKARTLQFFDSYKAFEMKLFFFYIFPIVMYNIISVDNEIYTKYVLNVFLQISTIGSLLKNTITKEFVDSIEKALFIWHKRRFQTICKSRYSTIKSHEVTHLAYVTKYHGPLNSFSTFAGESSLHDINYLLSSLLEIQILKNSNYLSLLSNGKFLNNMVSNLEKNIIDQDSYIYIREENNFDFLPFILEYIALDESNNIFFVTTEIEIKGTIENYIKHDGIEIVNLIKETNFFKKYYEIDTIKRNIKIFDACLKRMSFIKDVCIKGNKKSFICSLNSYEHN
uniref:Uncharacterized protein n=1 Tax=Strongyloides stercoralis TaxID=6248 RepID=A0AAF5DHF4_STRER